MLATEENDVRLNIRVDADLHRRLRTRAAERRTTSREIVAKVLREHLDDTREAEKTKK